MVRLLAPLLLLGFAPQQPPLVATSDPLTAEEQLKRFKLPPGFEIQLVASEPDVVKPMNLAFDDRGRIFVTQSYEYPYPAQEGARARDTVRLLEDFGPDGRARKVTPFVEGLNIPIGLLPTAKGVIVHSIPRIWACADEDGDGRAEKREPLLGDIGFADTHGMTNAFTKWVDGWVYACHGFANRSKLTAKDGSTVEMHSGNTYRMREDGSRVEYYTHGQVNPFGLSFDPLGNLYSADCHSKPAYHLLRGGWYPTFDGRHDGLGHAPNMMDHLHGSTGIAGIVYYAADHFPAPYRETIFMGNPVTGRVNHDRLEWRGSSPRAIAQPDFLSCDDPWFRPVDLKLASDGTIWIADFYNCIIGHYEVPLDHPKRDRTRGRIWRVVYRGEGAAPRPMPDLFKASGPELAALLGDANLQVRVRATNQLVERIGKEAVEPARKALADKNAHVRAHALWVLERLGALEDDFAWKLSDDPAPLVRVHLLKALAERKTLSLLRPLAGRAVRDGDPFVRRAAAEAIGLHPDYDLLASDVKRLVDLWESTPANDTHLVHAARMALRNVLRSKFGLRAAEAFPEKAAALAGVALGIPSQEAGRFVLEQLKAGKVGGALHVPALRHAARYAEPGLLEDVFRLARGVTDAAAAFRALHQALQERGMALPAGVRDWAEAAVRQILAADSPNTVKEGLQAARELKLEGCREEVAKLAEGRIKAPDVRSAALDALAALEPARSTPVLGAILGNAGEPVDLRQKAAGALGGMNDPKAREELVRQLRTASQPVAVAIATSLAARREGGETLLAAVSEGKASPRLLLERSVDGRLRAQGLSDRLARLTMDLPPEDDRVKKLIDARRAGYGKAKPAPVRGEEIYKKHCSGCHTVAGLGRKIGPELDGVGLRGLDRLLEDVLDPSRNVDQAFRATLLKTKDGRVISGLALREEGEVLVMIEAADKETRVALKEIEQRALSQLSPMPSNVADVMSEAEFYDLAAYLLSLRQAPK
jgi:putative heme-binding domain-containing protein